MKPGAWWWVDPRSRIVVRCRRAVQLNPIEFTIFKMLHRGIASNGTPYKVCNIEDVVAEVYRGVKKPPLRPRLQVAQSVSRMNRKLQNLQIRIEHARSRRNPLLRLVSL